MKFPVASHTERYYTCGNIMALTAQSIGLPVDQATAARWAETMALLADADDASEQDPNSITPTGLLTWLRLDPGNTDLFAAADNLIEANKQTHAADTISGHFASKGLEAAYSTDLLRYQLPSALSATNNAWLQLSRVSEAGIFVDSFFDAPEDARHFTQFSAGQLAFGAMRSFVRTARMIEPSTWKAVISAAHEYGLDTYLMQKPFRMFAKNSLSTQTVSH